MPAVGSNELIMTATRQWNTEIVPPLLGDLFSVPINKVYSFNAAFRTSYANAYC